MFRRISKFACREYKHLQFDKTKKGTTEVIPFLGASGWA